MFMSLITVQNASLRFNRLVSLQLTKKKKKRIFLIHVRPVNAYKYLVTYSFIRHFCVGMPILDTYSAFLFCCVRHRKQMLKKCLKMLKKSHDCHLMHW